MVRSAGVTNDGPAVSPRVNLGGYRNVFISVSLSVFLPPVAERWINCNARQCEVTERAAFLPN